MIDIEGIKHLCQIDIRAQDSDWESYQSVSSRDMLALIERLEAAERDAARYRYLRIQKAGISTPFFVVANWNVRRRVGRNTPNKERLDAGIDEAIAKEDT